MGALKMCRVKCVKERKGFMLYRVRTRFWVREIGRRLWKRLVECRWGKGDGLCLRILCGLSTVRRRRLHRC